MYHIGLTGNAAAGKSTVSALFQAWGATVIDADQLVHALQQPGRPVFDAIVARFGRTMLAPDGSLDRPALRTLVMEDPAARETLNAIVHPAVQAERERLVTEAAARGVRIVVHDIPLLFEVMDPGEFDLVVLVDAPAAIRRARLEGRGLSARAAERQMASQLDPSAKRGRSDFVIENDGSRDELTNRARAVWEAIDDRLASDPGTVGPA